MDPVQWLNHAISTNQTDLVESLLRTGTPVLPDEAGRHPLHVACARGNQLIVQLLLTLSDVDPDVPDKLGYTVLLKAAASGQCDILRLLLNHGHANVNQTHELRDNCALHESARRGFSRSVELLCEAGADTNRQNKDGFTPLHFAAQYGHERSACVLLTHGSQPDIQNRFGDTALHTATRYGQFDVVQILLSHQARVDLCNKNLDSPLHVAVGLRHYAIAHVLVATANQPGCAVNVRALLNSQGETALDVARRKNHVEFFELLSFPDERGSFEMRVMEANGACFHVVNEQSHAICNLDTANQTVEAPSTTFRNSVHDGNHRPVTVNHQPLLSNYQEQLCATQLVDSGLVESPWCNACVRPGEENSRAPLSRSIDSVNHLTNPSCNQSFLTPPQSPQQMQRHLLTNGLWTTGKSEESSCERHAVIPIDGRLQCKPSHRDRILANKFNRLSVICEAPDHRSTFPSPPIPSFEQPPSMNLDNTSLPSSIDFIHASARPTDDSQGCGRFPNQSETDCKEIQPLSRPFFAKLVQWKNKTLPRITRKHQSCTPSNQTGEFGYRNVMEQLPGTSRQCHSGVPIGTTHSNPPYNRHVWKRRSAMGLRSQLIPRSSHTFWRSHSDESLTPTVLNTNTYIASGDLPGRYYVNVLDSGNVPSDLPPNKAGQHKTSGFIRWIHRKMLNRN